MTLKMVRRDRRSPRTGQFRYGSFTGGTPCTNTVFGDPIVGQVKICYVQ